MKRKFDEMDLGSLPSGPVPTMSYERSRPQTPATTPGPPVPMTLGGEMPSMPAPDSQTPGQSTFMGSVTGGLASRGLTRSTTPFNPSMSVPATPPDLYLVTRSSPPIPQGLWENFQPNQLFPDDSGLSYFSPPSNPLNNLDPALQGGPNGPTNVMGGLSMSELPSMQQPQGDWGQLLGNVAGTNSGMPGSAGSPDDTWSNSSKGGIVPATLNVEDW
jgi:hypothetical protein